MLKHGEFVAPAIALLEGKEPVPNKVNDQALNGVLERFSKSKRSSDQPSAMNNVTTVFKDAIALQQAAASAQMRGVGLMSVAACVAVEIWAIWEIISSGILRVFTSWQHPFLALQMVVVAFLAFYVFPRWFLVFLRMDLFAPEDQPTVFDRKHRKVYRLFPPLDGSADTWWQRLSLKPIALQAVEYDWACITAEHRATLASSGQTVSRQHSLTLVVRDYRKSDEKEGRLLDEFDVGNSLGMGENTVPMLWEHIRRFMEDGGPGVPQGEQLQIFERPRSLWQSMGVVSPFGPKLGWWWRTNRFPTILLLLCFPFTLPFFTLWAVCNWISHKTMRKVVWPEEVRQRVGGATRSAGV